MCVQLLPFLPSPFIPSMASRIFLYRMMTDAGCAPNIDGGVCTLAICKPSIRRTANVGDIVIGLRARSGELGRLGPHAEDSVLYAMIVTRKMTFAEYDAYCTADLPMKIPSDEYPMGDCQYTADGTQRPGPHSPALIPTDLSGKYVLLSDPGHFWYRKDPVGHRLTPALASMLEVEKVRRGHCVHTSNALVVDALKAWCASFPTTNVKQHKRKSKCT